MASQETKKTNEIVDKFYEQMREVTPNFKTDEREHLLIVAAIGLAVKETLKPEGNNREEKTTTAHRLKEHMDNNAKDYYESVRTADKEDV